MGTQRIQPTTRLSTCPMVLLWNMGRGSARMWCSTQIVYQCTCTRPSLSALGTKLRHTCRPLFRLLSHFISWCDCNALFTRGNHGHARSGQASSMILLLKCSVEDCTRRMYG